MKEIAAILVLLVSVGAIIPGIVTLIDPPSLKLKSRWDALPMLSGFIAGLGIIMLVLPGEEDHAHILRLMGVLLLLLWAALFFFARSQATGGLRFDGKAQIINPDRTSQEVDARSRETRRRRIERQRAEDEVRRKIEREKAFYAERAAEARKSTGARWRDDDDLYDDDDEDYEDYEPEPSFHSDPNAPRHSSGSEARFVYVDANGEVTERQVVNWTSDGTYLKGHCLLRRSGRTFRLDRIEEWISG